MRDERQRPLGHERRSLLVVADGLARAALDDGDMAALQRVLVAGRDGIAHRL